MGIYKPSGELSPRNETAGSWVWNFSNFRTVRNTFLMLRSPSLWSSAAPAPGHSTAASVVPLGRGHSGRVWAPWSIGLICFSSCFNSKFPAIPLLKDEPFPGSVFMELLGVGRGGMLVLGPLHLVQPSPGVAGAGCLMVPNHQHARLQSAPVP